MKAYLKKMPGGHLYPDDEATTEYVAKIKIGDVIAAEITKPRNYEYHKKLFAMLQLGYDAWEPPPQEWHDMPVQKSFERFRKDCIIAAGFYEPVANLRGEVRAEAKSISFASMDEDEFERVYSAIADVLLQRVLGNYTRDDLDRVVNDLLGFV